MLSSFLEQSPERAKRFTTTSLVPVDRLYTPEDLEGFSWVDELGYPGTFPYTRGIHPTMFRGKLWTMRQFSGFGSAQQTNLRYRYLLKHGVTGLSVAFDLPTLMGYDSDHPLSAGEVGKCGVAISSLADMEVLFDSIPLGEVTTSMTINGPAAAIWAMYIAVCEKQGVPYSKIGGTLQNDILKEFTAQKEFIFPIRPSMRLVVDTIVFGTRQLPRWNTISISGYHIREAGSTAVQELAFTLRDGMEYVEEAVKAGLHVDEFAPRLSFFFNAHNDFFEEIAKYRAARRIWAKVMRDRYGAKDERSLKLRFHTQTAGCSLTAQQPYNNVVRVAIQALAAVMGGTQSLHTNSLDETLALPTEQAVTIALRTQQIIAHESGVTNVIDPVGGSYYIEKLTHDTELAAMDYIRRIDEMGGMVEAIERGFPQREIHDAAYQYQRAIERGEKVIVGVNAYQAEEQPIETLYIDNKVADDQTRRLRELRASRSNEGVRRALDQLRRTAQDPRANVMPALLEAARSYATLGEITDVFRSVFGTYEEPAVF
ncbi:MAG: methylmalonyl-CoA mutase family protein [Acidobacteriota bacterium]